MLLVRNGKNGLQEQAEQGQGRHEGPQGSVESAVLGIHKRQHIH